MNNKATNDIDPDRLKKLFTVFANMRGWFPNKYHACAGISYTHTFKSLRTARISPKTDKDEVMRFLRNLEYTQGIISISENPDEPGLAMISRTSNWMNRVPELIGRKIERRWSAVDADPIVRRLILTLIQRGEKFSIRKLQEETGIPRSTIERTKAWKALGSDKRRHITHNTEMSENSSVDCPKEA